MIEKATDLKDLTKQQIEKIKEDAGNVIQEIYNASGIKSGQIFLVGCSSSEIIGKHMGSASSADAAEAVYSVISSFLKEKGVYLAVQCCEHLNRAVVLDREVMQKYDFEEVNVIPQYHAGGAFAVTHYNNLNDPVVVENIRSKAFAGMDIGGVMIGMHIHPVVVPLRLEHKNIGNAIIIAARHRPKYVGGERAVYNANLE
ncbi:TIGR01440 family protein [Eubacterium ruminantium]|nr:TIGR01440 family protein [Eubacterium ruminantium]